jgi:hypothetical protein
VLFKINIKLKYLNNGGEYGVTIYSFVFAKEQILQSAEYLISYYHDYSEYDSDNNLDDNDGYFTCPKMYNQGISGCTSETELIGELDNIGSISRYFANASRAA